MMKAFAERIRGEFPALQQTVNGHPLVYLDNGATTQKPGTVIEVEAEFYRTDNANVHRSPHLLGQRATERYEHVREEVRQFIGAADRTEIVFTKGTTEGLNLIAYSYGSIALEAGDEILVSELEHHSNIVPWQLAAARTGASVKAIPVTPKGELDLSALPALLSPKTKIVSLAHVSNALGTIHPIREIIKRIRAAAPNAVVAIDGAQWVAHRPTNVQELDCDFYVFSGHKMFGPTGTGILYGKKALLNMMPPFLGGGDMIDKVSFAGTTYAEPPHRFEAGTPNIAGIIALGTAVEFIAGIDWTEMESHEREITSLVIGELKNIPGVTLIGEPEERMSAASFRLNGLAAMDVAVMLNQHGVAVRAGHHCCMPLMEKLGVDGTVRASWSAYNTVDDVHRFAAALREISAGKRIDPVNQAEGLTFAKPSAGTVSEAVSAIKTTFASVPDATSRQELLMELGAKHSNQLNVLRECAAPVQGCMSEVRLVTRIEEGKLRIASDSNAMVVRGLLELVDRAFSGQRAEEIVQFNPHRLLEELALSEFVSFQRRSGLQSVLTQIERAAQPRS